MKINPLVMIGVLLTTACQNREQTQINILEKDVMMIHDAVMPKMGELVVLENAIRRQITQTDSLPKITPNHSALNQLPEQSIRLSSQLKQADDAIMNWMHHYRGDSLRQLLPSQAIQAFTQEKIKIEQVSDDMLKRIEETQNFLKQQ
jgi:pyridoxal/pyridoxine/pyridoxamine kinase